MKIQRTLLVAVAMSAACTNFDDNCRHTATCPPEVEAGASHGGDASHVGTAAPVSQPDAEEGASPEDSQEPQGAPVEEREPTDLSVLPPSSLVDGDEGTSPDPDSLTGPEEESGGVAADASVAEPPNVTSTASPHDAGVPPEEFTGGETPPPEGHAGLGDASAQAETSSVPQCELGAHLCGDSCVADDDPMNCGSACEPCAAPGGGSVDCDGTECLPSCPQGQKLCAGSCIAESAACEGTCPSGTQNCNEVCVDPNSVANCGQACEVCSAPPGGGATCNGVSCDFACSAPFVKCEGACWDTSVGECCETADCGSGESCQANTCVDVQPPQVLSITPSSGAAGVESHQPIVITFSEVMDQASVSGALSITSLPVASRSLAWSAGGTVLTITPQGSGLPYAAGTNLSATAANQIAVSIGTSARDEAGVALTQPFDSQFSTLRRITDVLSSVAESEEYFEFSTGQRYHSTCPNLASGNPGFIYAQLLLVSYSESGGAAVEFYADAAQVAVEEVHTFESAVFKAQQTDWSVEDFFDGSALWLTRLQPSEAGIADDPNWRDWTVLDDLGVFEDSPVTSLAKDITASYWAAWHAGDTALSYRVYPWPDGSGNAVSGWTWLVCDSFQIELIYLVP